MPAGRPSDYSVKFCDQVHALAQGGATDREIAEALEIDRATFYRWCAAHPEFRDAVKLGKESADNRVERSLYHRAVGYSFDAIKIMQYEGQPVTVPYVEHVPPDTGAAFNWLKNRRGAEWRDRQEFTGAEGKDLIPAATETEMAKWVAFVLTAGARGAKNADEKA